MAVKTVSATVHQAGALSQCRGSGSSVSLGIGTSFHGKSCADPQADKKRQVSTWAGMEGTTRMLCRSRDLRKEQAVLFILAKQNLACSE